MKKSNQVNQKTCVLCGRIGLIILFLIGVIVGIIIKPGEFSHSVMTESQCKTIYSRMDDAIRYSNYDSYEKLNKIFTKNCSYFNFNTDEQKITKVENEKIPETTCGRIEMLLTERLSPVEEQSSESHIANAQIYANLSERGCSENSQKYQNLAKQELEIARALNNDNMEGYHEQQETIEIVETYKRLQMQAEAEKIIEKAKKLTDPAIDFIIQLEKIIEE